jgi:transcriptional regulator with XRE-family HTH domain
MKKSTAESRGKVLIDLLAIGRRIRELRGFDTSQAIFAKRVGVTQGYLSALERGAKEPGAAVLLAISREFGKSVDWLLTGEIVPHRKKARSTTS